MKHLLLFFFCLCPVFIYAQNTEYNQYNIKNHPDYRLLEELINPYGRKMTDIKAEFDQFLKASPENKNNETQIAFYQDQYKTLMMELDDTMKNFVRKHPDSQVSLVVIYQLLQANPEKFGNSGFGDIETLYLSIGDSLKNTGLGRNLAAQITQLKKTALGSTAPEFTQNDVNGNPIRLSDFRGKYVLVDFWASWCGPCRRENPNVVNTYKKFKEKNFEIVGISLDNSKKTWLATIESDKLSWPQVSDLNGWKNEVAVLYDVRSIPQNFLLDPEGKIIAKNLIGAALETKLSEILE